MKLELRQIFESDSIKRNFDYEFSVEDDLIPSPVSVSGYIKNSSGIVSVSATADLTVSTQCAKCAKQICKKLTVPVEHYLTAQLNNEDNDDYILVEDMVLDLDELVSEDIFLALPSRFLCKPDCKGLCPMCGKDLNEGKCDCKKQIDPRLSVLQQLLSDDE